MKQYVAIALIGILWAGCAKDAPFLSGIIRRAKDAAITPCDPYNDGAKHTCVVFNPLFSNHLVAYDASFSEMVLAPIRYFPLKIPVGNATVDLVAIKTKPNESVPFMLALDASGKIFVVRTAPSDDKKISSFAKPKEIDIGDPSPYKMAAYLSGNKIHVFVTFPEGKKIRIIELNAQTGERENNIVKMLGAKPSHIAIDDDLLHAVISDEEDNNLHVQNLTTSAWSDVGAGTFTGEVSFAKRDLGKGSKLYALALSKKDSAIVLVDIDASTHETAKLNEKPTALYFPKDSQVSCCGGLKAWAQVATIQGNITYLDLTGGVLKEKEIVDAKVRKYMNVGHLRIGQMIGGSIIKDTKSEHELGCERKIYYTVISASSRETGYGAPVEVEAQGVSCEGELPRRLGAKKED